jgi:hypothetical protein
VLGALMVCLCVVLQVRSRMESESGISFTEFTYQLLQGYDFVHLARNHGVRMQVGCAGSRSVRSDQLPCIDTQHVLPIPAHSRR